MYQKVNLIRHAKFFLSLRPNADKTTLTCQWLLDFAGDIAALLFNNLQKYLIEQEIVLVYEYSDQDYSLRQAPKLFLVLK